MVAAAPPATPMKFTVTSGPQKRGERIVIYGDGGLGKSTLASLAPGALFLDGEGSSGNIDTRRVDIESWPMLLQALREESLWKGVETVVLDSGTAMQEKCVAHTIATVKHEKGTPVTRMEDYGFGRGYRHVYDTFLPLLAELDRHAQIGRNVVLVCHQTTEQVPNPEGEDYLRYVPALQQPPKEGKIRDRVVAWADHVFFLQLDKFVKDGKATGHGSRAIYTQGRPTFTAKSRTLDATPLVFQDPTDDTLWRSLGLKV